MTDLHDVLVALTSMEHGERLQALAEHRGTLLSDAFVNFVEQQNNWAPSLGVEGDEWQGVPDMLTDAFAAGNEVWAERVQAVWTDMINVANASPAAEPDPSSSRRTTAGTGQSAPRANPPTPTTPTSTFVDTSPTEEEIHQDFVEWDRLDYADQQESIEYNRIRDDAIDYSTPSYDTSYDDYDY